MVDNDDVWVKAEAYHNEVESDAKIEFLVEINDGLAIC